MLGKAIKPTSVESNGRLLANVSMIMFNIMFLLIDVGLSSPAMVYILMSSTTDNIMPMMIPIKMLTSNII